MTITPLRDRLEAIYRQHDVSLTARQDFGPAVQQVERLIEECEDALHECQGALVRAGSVHAESAGEVLESIENWKEAAPEPRQPAMNYRRA